MSIKMKQKEKETLSILMVRFHLSLNESIILSEQWFQKYPEKTWSDLKKYLLEGRVIFKSGKLHDLNSIQIQNLLKHTPLTSPSKIKDCLSQIHTSFTKVKPLIACVDDSKTVQYFVKKTLESSGYRVLTILDPTKQFSDLFKRKPLLILMDIDMPDINGHQLCTILQRSRATKNIPIIMLTGKKGMIPRIRAQFNQVKDYLTKPCQPELLVSSIQKFVG